jgi:FixJ family two-component response regulator
MTGVNQAQIAILDDAIARAYALSLAPELIGGCVLLDIRMPGMGGLELQMQLKSVGFKPPIIVMTLKGDMENAVKGGAVDFLEKPFNEEGLLGAIDAALAIPPGQPVNAKAWRPPNGSRG